mgnify:CR=1 FL=1
MADQSAKPSGLTAITTPVIGDLYVVEQADGTTYRQAGVFLPVYTVATVPSAVTYVGRLIRVSNEVGGHTVAFSDGTNWRRLQDLTIVA